MIGGKDKGGSGIYYENKILMPKKHSIVTITFTAYAIGSWNNEFFLVSLDGNEIIR